MARIAIVFALTATLLGVSGLASRAQSGPPNYSEDQRMSMCRAMFRGTIAKCECILKTMHKHITREHANIIFWLNYDNPSAARAYLAERRKRDPQMNRKFYNASYPGWIEAQKNCTWL